jgi:Zn-dependent metalloprotease
MNDSEHPHSHCTCFIIPSRVLRKMADKATGAEREALLDQIEHSAHLRGMRAAIGASGASLATGEKRRTVYNAKHKTKLPGALARGEGAAATTDAAVNQAYDGAGITYDFFFQILGRNSIDGQGMRLDSTVHYSKAYNNAFWNGTQMVYGDGDGKLFNNFTSALDVIGHELTHGVTQFTVPGGQGLAYEGQSGALNESFSDVFGSIVKQWHANQTVDQADWLIGAGIMTPQVGKALRSLADPGNTALTWSHDDQPKDMTHYVEGGDVHTNSGIPNHAFYLAAKALGGHSWDKTGKIWYKALGMLTTNATFADAAHATINAAILLFGANGPEVSAVTAAWQGVKVI